MDLIQSVSTENNQEKSEFARLLEENLKTVELTEGKIVRGTVVSLAASSLLVDVGFKSEGFIPRDEFGAEADNLKIGQEVEVFIDRIDDDSGRIYLSKRQARATQAWGEISKACEEDAVVEGVVTQKVRGGLTVDVGVLAFLPSSQIDLRPPKNLDPYVGKKFRFKVIKYNEKRGNVVLSRRALLEEERDTIKQKTLENIEEGQVVKGVVKNITEYGAFLDLGGIDGLLHVTDMSWGRVENPQDICKVGDSLEVKVLKYDPERERVSLGLKQISKDPWENVEEQFTVGQKLKGKVVSLTNYGAFVELAPGIEGLIHISEMSWTKKIAHPSQILKLNDEVESMVLDVDSDSRRISLGLKQLEQNPWDILEDKYPPGTKVKCKIKNMTDFGIFVGAPESPIDGLIHVSDLSWTKKVANPSDLYKKDEEIEAVVLSIDKLNEKFSLGVKQLQPDPWQDVEEIYPVGSIVEGKVVKVTDFGAFVELKDGVEALIRTSELSKEKVENIKDHVKEGDSLKCLVINLDFQNRKMAVSVRQLHDKEEKDDLVSYLKDSEKASKATLGDLLKSKKKKKEE